MSLFALIIIAKEFVKLTDVNNPVYWEKNLAEIQKLKLTKNRGDDDDFPYDVFPILKCEVTYSYTYKNKKYTGHTLILDFNKEDNQFHESAYEKLKDAKKINIWINPKVPNDATIILNLSSFDNIVFGLIFLAFPLSILGLLYVRKKHPVNELANKLEIIK